MMWNVVVDVPSSRWNTLMKDVFTIADTLKVEDLHGCSVVSMVRIVL